MSLTIRYAFQDDLEAVNKLREEVNALHVNGRPDIFCSGYSDALADYLYDCAKSDSSDVIVAVKDNRICGFAIVEYIEKPQSPYMLARKFYHIAEFGVDAACRHQGTGTAIMDYCRDEAKKKGFSRIELSVWEFNSSALEFYSAAGFKTARRYMELDIEKEQ